MRREREREIETENIKDYKKEEKPERERNEPLSV